MTRSGGQDRLLPLRRARLGGHSLSRRPIAHSWTAWTGPPRHTPRRSPATGPSGLGAGSDGPERAWLGVVQEWRGVGGPVRATLRATRDVSSSSGPRGSAFGNLGGVASWWGLPWGTTGPTGRRPGAAFWRNLVMLGPRRQLTSEPSALGAWRSRRRPLSLGGARCARDGVTAEEMPRTSWLGAPLGVGHRIDRTA